MAASKLILWERQKNVESKISNFVDRIQQWRSLALVDGNKRRNRSATPPVVQMKLIRPGKRKVKVTPNAIENTPKK